MSYKAGTVPDRGAAFVHLSTLVPAIKEKIEDAEERLGADIIQKALVAQASLVAQNAGVEGEVVVEKVKESEWEFGYNAMTEKCENLVESGVIDPAKVTRCALQDAASGSNHTSYCRRKGSVYDTCCGWCTTRRVFCMIKKFRGDIGPNESIFVAIRDGTLLRPSVTVCF